MISAIGSSKRPRFFSGGLSLIEILVSVAILSSSVVFVMQALARIAHTLRVTENRLGAYAFAVSQLSEIEMTLEAEGVLKKQGTFQIGKERLRWRVDAAALPEDPRFEQITLSINWKEGKRDTGETVSMLRRLPKVDSDDGN